MSDIVPITPQTHAGRRWQRFTSYAFAARTAMAPVVTAELPKAVRSLPLVFIRHQDRFVLSALMSPVPGKNLYIAPDGKWLGGYIPSTFRGYPFSLATDQDTGKRVVCVDETSGLITEDTTLGEPFFDDSGAPAEVVQAVVNFLNQVADNRDLTDRAVAALAGAGCITPWDLTLQDHKVDGCHRIDETRLNTLPDEDFLALRRAGSLLVAYGQLLSMANVQIFGRLAAISEKLSPQPREFDDTLLDDGTIIG